MILNELVEIIDLICDFVFFFSFTISPAADNIECSRHDAGSEFMSARNGYFGRAMITVGPRIGTFNCIEMK